MLVIKEEGSRPIKAWVEEREVPLYGFEEGKGIRPARVPNIEDGALQQLKDLARMPFLAPNGIAVMPDVHKGIGATVGSVVATSGAIIPAAVGVDIGCGMNAVRTSLRAEDLPDSLLATRLAIEAAVPVGKAGHTREDKVIEAGDALVGVINQPGWRHIHEAIDATSAYGERIWKKAREQLGTLGGGNHFIELCIDEAGFVWVMLHSGSRGLGNMVGTAFISKAKEESRRWFIDLPDADLAYLPEGTPVFDAYVAAVSTMQDYALLNRKQMMAAVLRALRDTTMAGVTFSLTTEAVNCHHNYISKENHFGKNLWVTRKGAIRARLGDLGIIPGSMGAKSYIVRGKGNPESYCSCSHGAGRTMSRTDAIKRFTVDDLANQTVGVECRKDAAVIEEIPSSYKSIEQVMANQADLVEIVHTLKQVVCVKGA
jgi:tRNA-splicing ligase RtcB